MKTSALTASLLLSMLTVPPTFAARDAKVYPGSMAVRINSSQPTPKLSASSIFNPSSTQWLNVELPVIHDTIGHTIRNGWVKALDRHYSADVSARLRSFYWSNTRDRFLGWWSARLYSAGSGNDAQTLSFPGVGSNSIAHYHYSCAIPPTYLGRKSGILSYYVREND